MNLFAAALTASLFSQLSCDPEVRGSVPECVHAEVLFKVRCTLVGFQRMHLGEVTLVSRFGGNSYPIAECTTRNRSRLLQTAQRFFTTNQSQCYVPVRPPDFMHVDFQLALRRNWAEPLEILNGMYCNVRYVDNGEIFPRTLAVGDMRYWSVSLCDPNVHGSVPECVRAEVVFTLRCTLAGFPQIRVGRVQLVSRVDRDTYIVAECIAHHHYRLHGYAEHFFTSNQTWCNMSERSSGIIHVDFQLALHRNWTKPLEILKGMFCNAIYADHSQNLSRQLAVGDTRYWNVSLCDPEVHGSAPGCVDAEVVFTLRCTLVGFQEMSVGKVQLVSRVGRDSFAVAECIAHNRYHFQEYADPYFTTNQSWCYVPEGPPIIMHIDFLLALRRNWMTPLEILNGMYCNAEYRDASTIIPQSRKVGDMRYWNVSLCAVSLGMTTTEGSMKEYSPTLALRKSSPQADVDRRPAALKTTLLVLAFGAGAGVVFLAAFIPWAFMVGLRQRRSLFLGQSVHQSDDISSDDYSTHATPMRLRNL